jgi:hypothetical protein
MGSASSGNITHLAGENASSKLGVKVTHVPFAGSAPAIVSLIGGNIDLIYDALPSSMQQASANRIHALAILDTNRFHCCRTCPPCTNWLLGNRGKRLVRCSRAGWHARCANRGDEQGDQRRPSQSLSWSRSGNLARS